MRPETIDFYVKAADLGMVARKVRPSVQTQDSLPRDVVDRLGTATLLIGRYHKVEPELFWITAPDGRRFWMMDKMYRIWLSVESRLRAERDLRTSDIARAAGVSQGYVSKVLRKFQVFGLITILGAWRGRWGRIVAKLKIQLFHPKYVESRGGIFNRRIDGEWVREREYQRRLKLADRVRERMDNPWGPWYRSWARILAAHELENTGG